MSSPENVHKAKSAFVHANECGTNVLVLLTAEAEPEAVCMADCIVQLLTLATQRCAYLHTPEYDAIIQVVVVVVVM